MKNLSFYCLFAMLFSVLSACKAQQSAVTMPTDVPILTREQWGSPEPIRPMKEHVPVRITIHNTGVKQNPKQTLTQKLKGLYNFSINRSVMGSGAIHEPWADICYHFYIDLNGEIAEARKLKYIGESNTPYDPTGHALIVLEGSFGKEEVNDAQYQSLEKLVVSVAKRFKIPSDSIGGHRDYASTTCPGDNLYAMLPRLRLAVKTATNK